MIHTINKTISDSKIVDLDETRKNQYFMRILLEFLIDFF